MKSFILLMVLFYTVIGLSGSVIAAEYITVGPAEAGDCDYTSIQDALDNVLPVTEHIRVVAATYNETVGITDQSINLTGGYADCGSAQSDNRITGSMSTLDPFAHGMYISSAIGGDIQSVNITGFNVVDGLAGFINSGGINIVGEVNVSLIESRVGENSGSLGGGIYIEAPATLFVHDTIVENNEAVMGGGIYCNGCTLVMNGASGVSDNEADGNDIFDGIGGGLYITDAATVSLLSGSVYPITNNHGIHSNVASEIGGGIYVEDSELALFGHLTLFGFGSDTDPVNITNNSSGGSGGGLYITGGSTVNATAIDVRNNNSGDAGAAFFIQSSSSLIIDMKTAGDELLDNCWSSDKTKCNRISNNYVANGFETGAEGGAIRALNSEVRLEHVWFEENSASDGSGAVIRHQGHFGEGLWIENTVMYNNGAGSQDDSVIHLNNSHINMRSNTLVDNNVNDSVVILTGTPEYDFYVHNNIIHNVSGGDVITLAAFGGSPDVVIDCVLIDSKSNITGQATSVFTGDPNFFDRGSGNLHLTSNSHQAVDRCPPVQDANPVDVDLEERVFDVVGMGNDLVMNVADIGADEFTGNDIDLDIIFVDGFD